LLVIMLHEVDVASQSASRGPEHSHWTDLGSLFIHWARAAGAIDCAAPLSATARAVFMGLVQEGYASFERCSPQQKSGTGRAALHIIVERVYKQVEAAFRKPETSESASAASSNDVLYD
jgi:hypothetical protein